MLRCLLPIGIVLALACAGPTDDGDKDGDPGDTEDPTTPAVDDDADGYDTTADCNDGNPDIHPGAAEVCDPGDVDEDCNGLADSADPGLTDGSAAHHDADGDGYGEPDDTNVCEIGGAYVEDGSDCDDGKGDVHPGAVEICDEADVDEDCSGAADDDDPAVTGTWTFYTDADGDGAGDERAPVQACDAGGGLVTEAGDCDDADPASSTAPTWFRDADGDRYGTDGDTVDACEAPAGYVAEGGDCDDGDRYTSPRTAWYTDADGDGDGDVSLVTRACEQPAGTVATATDCDDADAAVSPAADEVCANGVDDDCDGGVGDCMLADLTLGSATADATFVGETGADLAGFAVSFADDLDGDGLDDMLVIASGYDGGTGSYDGAAYVLYGGAAGMVDLSAADRRFHSVEGGSVWDVAGVGDLDGDGYGDFAVGEYGGNEGAVGGGAAFLVYGPPPASGNIASVAGVGELQGPAYGYCGRHVAGGGDLTGDGGIDVVVSCHDGDTGTVYVVDEARTGTSALSAVAAASITSTASAFVGLTTAVAGDIDGDGVDDLLLGGYPSNAARVVYGPVSGSASVTSFADVTLTEDGQRFGLVVAGVGDLDGDGYADAGVYGIEDDGLGVAWIFPGGSSGVADGEGWRITSSGDTDPSVGESMAAAGDVDGDGASDLLLGASNYRLSGTSYGAAYLVYGPIIGDTDLEDAVRFRGGLSGDSAGNAVAGGGDVDGNGLADLLIGAYYEDSGGSAAGAAYLVLGTGL